jgi:hypothetical protein
MNWRGVEREANLVIPAKAGIQQGQHSAKQTEPFCPAMREVFQSTGFRLSPE